MSAHTCRVLTPGCYRCELNRDEIEHDRREVAQEAQEAWLKYRDDYMRARLLNAKRAGSQMRRREFIAGYFAASGYDGLEADQ